MQSNAVGKNNLLALRGEWWDGIISHLRQADRIAFSTCSKAARALVLPHLFVNLKVASNATSAALEQVSPTALAFVRHASVISTPGDDLAEEDFIPRIHRVVTALPALAQFTLTIPTMARLHPSNSLPKVVTVFESLRALQPELRFGLVVRADAGQIFSSGPLLQRLAQETPRLTSLALTGTNFLLEDLAPAVAKCGITDLSFDNCQITYLQSVDSADFLSLQKLSLSMDSGLDEKSVAGHQALLKGSQSTLQELALVSCQADFLDGVEALQRLETLSIREDVLCTLSEQPMPSLRELQIQRLVKSDNVEHLVKILKSSGCRIHTVHVATLPAGIRCEGFLALRKTIPQVSFRIGEYVTEPSAIDIEALEIAESFATYGAPSAASWPVPEDAVRCPHLRTLNLKVVEGSNYADFLAKLEMVNLDGPPKVTVAKKKQPKAKKNRT